MYLSAIKSPSTRILDAEIRAASLSEASMGRTKTFRIKDLWQLLGQNARLAKGLLNPSKERVRRTNSNLRIGSNDHPSQGAVAGNTDFDANGPIARMLAENQPERLQPIPWDISRDPDPDLPSRILPSRSE